MAHWREFLDPAAPPGDYLPWKVVARRTSLSRTTAWRLQRRDEFPRPYPISPGRVGHLECEVEAWIRARARAGASSRLRGLTPPVAQLPAKSDPLPAAQTSGLSVEDGPALRSDAPTLRPTPVGPPGAALRNHPETARAKPGRRRTEHAKAIAQQMRFDF